MKAQAKAFVVVVAVALLLLVGSSLMFGNATAVGSMRTETRIVPLEGASAARVELTMDSGALRLGSGATSLLDGTFAYNVDAWEPEIGYQVISREGVLRLEQGEPASPFPVADDDAFNAWDLSLTPNVPLDLAVDLGSADGAFALGDLRLLGLEIEGDGGDAVVDLSSPLANDLDVRLATDGDLILTLPTQVGVRVVVESGQVLSGGGLQGTGGTYVNERYGATPFTLTVTIEDAEDVTLIHDSIPAPAAPSPLGSVR